jgi:hypothetical protein
VTIQHLCNANISKALCPLFNFILATSKIPPSKTKPNIIFVLKGDGPCSVTIKTLGSTTLLECIQRVFVKFIFGQITSDPTNLEILKGAYSRTLPSTSTHSCLLHSNVFVSETKMTGKQGHLFLEKKSAAFDLIGNDHISMPLQHIVISICIVFLYINKKSNRTCQVFTAYGLFAPF